MAHNVPTQQRSLLRFVAIPEKPRQYHTTGHRRQKAPVSCPHQANLQKFEADRAIPGENVLAGYGVDELARDIRMTMLINYLPPSLSGM